MKSLNKYCFCLLFILNCISVAYGQPIPDFSASSTSGCAPFNVQFKDLSLGNPSQWFWDFGNGSTSTLQNPVATYLLKGIYTVRLIAKNASGGDYITKQNYITIDSAPVVSFTINKDSGCTPLNINFSNNTNTSGIKNWLWDFGDGTTSTQQNVSHIYNARGIYDVTLTAQNVQGCSNTFKITGAIKAGNAPINPSFKGSPLNGCASSFRNFKSASASTINGWLWNFGDGNTDNTARPSHHYKDTGWFNVKLVASDNGCSSTIQYNNYIHITGPVSNFHRFYDCEQPFNIRFSDHSIGAKSWSWDFGDGNTTSVKNPTHTYSANGIYTVALTVSAGACTDSSNYTIYVIKQNPSFAVTPLKNAYCKNDTITFTATSYDSSLVRTFSWSFDGGITQTPYHTNTASVKNVYTNAGTYSSPILYILNNQFCYDTIKQKPLSITGTSAQFVNRSPGCVGSNITFSDKSTLYKNAPVKQWKWNFGNGDSIATSSSKITDKFSFPGTYTVLLKITDVNGCSDTISHAVNIIDKPVIDAGKDTSTCAGKSVTLQATGGTAYTWVNNAYLSCTNCANPSAAPVSATTFYVTGKNSLGCTAQDSVTISVKQHQQLTVQPLNDTICAGDTVHLMAFAYDYYKWQPAAGLSNTGISNPVATPPGNIVYTVTGTDKSGCFTSTASVNLITGTKPVLNIKDTEITVLPGTAYRINISYSSNITKWQWQPAQWLSDPTVANPVASPQQSITYTVYGATAAGCVTIDRITINVTCNNVSVYVPNIFSPNGDGVNDYFFPRSSGNISFKSFKIFNRWGQEVFRKDDFTSNDQNAGWDGKYKGASQQPDVYMYLLQSACANGKIFTSHGSVTLIR